MALSQNQRDALPSSHFAVPGKRELPFPDAEHVRLAWDMVDRTQGLTPSERSTARTRIKRRAKELGVDTSDWNAATLAEALEMEAMSLAVPSTPGHLNKMPFSGVLTRVDEPSDAPPGGSGGRRVILTRAAAEEALPGLLGMAVDFTPNLDGHDAQAKIGIIDSAEIEGSALVIGGFVWQADFPAVAAEIKAKKDVLGFSYELKGVSLEDPAADPLVIKHCTFTGAAILRKANAAYHSTSLAAAREGQDGDVDMTKEELIAALGPVVAEAIAPLKTELEGLKAGQTKLDAALAASKEAQGKVQPHADALRACADGMTAAAIGGHPSRGHAAIARKMADDLEASAAMGQIPHIYRDHDFFTAAADPAADPAPKLEDDPAFKALKDSIGSLGTKLDDLKAAGFNAATEPDRKTIPADIRRLLARHGVDLNAGAEGEAPKALSLEAFNGFLDKSEIHGQEAIRMKLLAREAGILQADA